MGLDSIELIMEVEERFAVSFSDEEIQTIWTVGDLVDLATGKIAEEQRHQYPDVEEIIRKMIVTNFQIPPKRITRDAKIVTDLGIE